MITPTGAAIAPRHGPAAVAASASRKATWAGHAVALVAGLGLMMLAPGVSDPGTARAAEPALTAAPASLASVAPPTQWRELPAATTTLTRIGVGSCLDQNYPQPIWQAIVASRPQLFLMIGDNVYGDVKGPEMTELIAAYRTQSRHPEFQAARAALSFLATWDDHDFGANDAGAEFAQIKSAKALFHDYWQIRPEREQGLYYSRLFGPAGQRVQIIMLDPRTFRSPLKVKSSSFPHWGRYEPDPTPGKTVLGAEQWTWLEAELRKPAEIRLLVSGYQFLAEGHGFERWGNLPAERDKLLALIDKTSSNGLIMLSGDRHSGALYAARTPSGRKLYEMTSSSLNRSYGASKDALIPPLIGKPYHPENFGLIELDWSGRMASLKLLGMGGQEVGSLMIPFADIGTGN